MAPNLRLAGAPNFRDLGGYVTGDGLVVKMGRLFRSSHLAHLIPADGDVLRQLAIQTVIDLRAAGESKLYPPRWPEGTATEWVQAGINPLMPAGKLDYKQQLMLEPTPEGALKAMALTYQQLPAACGPALKTTIELAVTGKSPLVFHCSNGRDRTGFIAMMLLHILDVPHAQIVADYLETNDRLDLEQAIKLSEIVFSKEYGLDLDEATLRSMNQALPQNVDVAFAAMATGYGSTEVYLEAFGISMALRDSLRNIMLERAES